MRALVVVAVAVGCAHPPPARAPTRCDIPVRALEPSNLGVFRERMIYSVEITGVDPELAHTLERGLATRSGDRLDNDKVARDVQHLYAQGAASEVRVVVEAGHYGTDVRFELVPQPLIDRVYVTGADLPELRRLRMLAGTPLDPARLERVAEAIRSRLAYDGYLDAKIAVHRSHAPGVDVCVSAEPGPRVVIDRFEFPGRTVVSARDLVAKLDGEKAGINHRGGIYDAQLLERDHDLMLAPYLDRGRLDVSIAPATSRREGDHLVIEMPIREGDVYRVRRVFVAAPLGDAISLGIARGDVYSRSQLAEAVQRITNRTGDDSAVIPITTIDHDRHEVDIAFQITWRWPWLALRLLRSR